jgi:hypothetical protein
VSTRELSNKTKNSLLVLMHAIFRHDVKLYDLPVSPLASVDRFRVRSSGDIQVFSPEEVWSLVRAAASDTDAAIQTNSCVHRPAPRRAARPALWDVDFAESTIRVRASYAAGHVTTPKSGRSAPCRWLRRSRAPSGGSEAFGPESPQIAADDRTDLA